VAGARKAAHVRPDLGQDELGAAPVNARDGVEQVDQLCERGDRALDLGAQGESP